MVGLKVLVLARESDVYVEGVRACLPDALVSACSSYEALGAALDDHRPEIVLASKIGLPFPREILFRCPSLQWVQTVSAGVDHLLPLDPRIQVTSASGIHDEALADYIIASVLLWNLHFPRFFRQQQARIWKSDELVPSKDQTLAILGLGSIGTLAARKAKALGMRALGVRARPEIRPEGVDEVYGNDELPQVAARADFLAVTLPLTERTRGIVSRDVLRAMKPGSVLVNLSRGGIVDEAALVEVLREGPLEGAVMDVFATEPLPRESPLWELPNLVITPHTGDILGWQNRVVELFCANLKRWRDGVPLENLVDPDRGY
jgi:phosphoglycerate dehydrogenase-like enzyme